MCPLESGGRLEDAAFSLEIVQQVVSTEVGDILTEDDNAIVVAELVPQTPIDQFDHRLGLTAALRIMGEVRAGWVGVRIDERQRRSGGQVAPPRRRPLRH